MSNEEKIDFNVMLDIAHDNQKKQMEIKLEELKTKHAPMIDSIFDYYLLERDKQEFKNEFHSIVTSWYLQDTIKAKIWIEENNKAINTEHEMQLRYDIWF